MTNIYKKCNHSLCYFLERVNDITKLKHTSKMTLMSRAKPWRITDLNTVHYFLGYTDKMTNRVFQTYCFSTPKHHAIIQTLSTEISRIVGTLLIN